MIGTQRCGMFLSLDGIGSIAHDLGAIDVVVWNRLPEGRLIRLSMIVGSVVVIAGLRKSVGMPVVGYVVVRAQASATAEDARPHRPQAHKNKGRKQEARKSRTNSMRSADASPHEIDCS